MTKEHILLVIRDTYPTDHDKAADIIMQAWKNYCLSEEQEEREAWDRYAASGLHWNTDNVSQDFSILAKRADCMLIERRKRFGKIE